MEIRFNALDGSNTRPSAVFDVPSDADTLLQKCADKRIFFESLRSVDYDEKQGQLSAVLNDGA